MISFWVNQAGSRGLRRYRDTRGRAVADRFQIQVYDDIGAAVRVSSGTQLFAAIDQLTPSQRDLAAWIWDQHARIAPAALRVNDPRHVLLRLELLRALHAHGLNAFRVYPASAFGEVQQFPVFVRQLNRHNGPRTALLETSAALVRALRGLRFRGYRMDDLMIVEYCDTSDRNGIFRKYAAYKVGGEIVPCHVFRSQHWCAKSSDNTPDEAGIHDEAAFIRDNPHREWLEQVFRLARIDYGRVDYGVLNGVPQVWEINLNPTLGSGTGALRHTSLTSELRRLREEGRADFHRRLQAAFVSLDRGGAETTTEIAVPRTLVDQLSLEVRQRQRREHMVRWMRDLPDTLRLARPLRAAYARLFPRS